jgi:hypothetical protein
MKKSLMIIAFLFAALAAKAQFEKGTRKKSFRNNEAVKLLMIT